LAASLRLPPSRINAIASNRLTCSASTQRRDKLRKPDAEKSPRTPIDAAIANLLLLFAMVNQKNAPLGSTHESASMRLGIRASLAEAGLKVLCRQQENNFPIHLPNWKFVSQLQASTLRLGLLIHAFQFAVTSKHR
jgi:hypothetical protein